LQVVKNKCAPPYKIAEFDIMFGSGISSLGCLLDAAEGVDVVQRKGSWYSFGDQKLGQGREKTMAILAESKDMQRSASLDLPCKCPCHLAWEASLAEFALT
jgi:recombination protein RecA